MRLVLLLGVMAALSACDETPTAPAPVPVPGPDGREASALTEAAEKTCSEMTGYAADKLGAMTAEMRALVTREYNSCISSVGRGEAPERPGGS